MERGTLGYRLVQLWLYGPITILFLIAGRYCVREATTPLLFGLGTAPCILVYSALTFAIWKYESTNRLVKPQWGRLGIFGLAWCIMTGLGTFGDLMRHKDDLLFRWKTALCLLIVFARYLLFFELRRRSTDEMLPS